MVVLQCLAHESGQDATASDQTTGCKASAHTPHPANAEREGCEAAPTIQRHREPPEAKTLRAEISSFCGLLKPCANPFLGKCRSQFANFGG